MKILPVTAGVVVALSGALIYTWNKYLRQRPGQRLQPVSRETALSTERR